MPPRGSKGLILLLQAATGWSIAATAHRFLVTTHTLGTWKQKLDDAGEAALVRLAQPVNRFPDQVRQLVRDLKRLYPSMGRQRIADVLARTGLVLAASTVRRMLHEAPTASPESAPQSRVTTQTLAEVTDTASCEDTAQAEPSTPKGVTARYTDHVWHCDLTLVPTAAGFWVPWLPFAVWLGWPFTYWVVGVVDQFSRASIKLKAFKQHPSGRDVRRFLDSAIRRAGRAPKHLISDQGVQFRQDYRRWCARRGIKPRWGAVGNHGSIAIIERFWRSMKAECCRLLLVPLKPQAFQAELDCYAAWFGPTGLIKALVEGRLRKPSWKLPTVLRLEPRPRMPIRGAPDSGRSVSSVKLRVTPFAGKRHLPSVEVQAA